MELSSNQIQNLLPHRWPFLLVDKIIDFSPGQWAYGIKCVTASEPWFMGHFPQYHVMPGVLILEALSQVGAVAVLSKESNQGKLAFLGGIKEARFKEQVRPGDVLKLECRLVRERGAIGIGEAVATVGDKVAAKATITFAIGE